MTVTDIEFRKLAKRVTIDDVQPIDNADKIEKVVVDGWRVVSQKGLYKPGDDALYFEIDSLLPLSNPAFEFLRERGGIKVVGEQEYHRLRTVKLRGVISQGLLVPLSEFGDLEDAPEDFDWTAALGVKKMEDFLPGTIAGRQIGRFPTELGPKTDAERAQNLTKRWESIREHGPWFATEKIDGTSLSVFRKDGELIVCSRNWQIDEDDNNLYWKAVHKYATVFDSLREGWGIQAEIYGPGIQNNPLAVAEPTMSIFNVLDHGNFVPRALWSSEFQHHGVPTYDDLVLPKTVDEAVQMVYGLASKVNPKRQAEGIVWVAGSGEPMDVLGYRPSFKVINDALLILKDKS